MTPSPRAYFLAVFLVSGTVASCSGPDIPVQTGDVSSHGETGGAAGGGGSAGEMGGGGGATAGSGGAAAGSGDSGGDSGGTAGDGGGPAVAGAGGDGGGPANGGGAGDSAGGSAGVPGGGGCGDLYDDANCGACGVVCDGTDRCIRGVCGRRIGSGSTGYFTLVTVPDGRVYGWGVNKSGALATGKVSNLTPLQWSTKLSNVLITAGRCAIKKDGTVWCWGANDWGELANGMVGGPDDISLTPLYVHLPSRALDLTFGGQWDLGYQVCALLENRSVYCWGENTDGLVEIGGPDQLTSPVLLLAGPVVQIGGGRWIACALLPGGDLSCWGQLDGADLDVNVPKVVASNIASFDTGQNTLVAVTRDGAVMCIGPSSNCGTDSPDNTSLTQVPGLPGDSKAIYAVSTQSGCCALLDNHDVWCWGGNSAYAGKGGALLSVFVPPTKIPLEDVLEISATLGAVNARTASGDIWTLGATWDSSIGPDPAWATAPRKRNPPPW